MPVVAGQTLQGVPDIGLLLLTSRDGRPVYVKDVADVVVGAAEPDIAHWTLTRDGDGQPRARPTVSIALAKRKGANAVVVAEELLQRAGDGRRAASFPDDLESRSPATTARPPPRRRTSCCSISRSPPSRSCC